MTERKVYAWGPYVRVEIVNEDTGETEVVRLGPIEPRGPFIMVETEEEAEA